VALDTSYEKPAPVRVIAQAVSGYVDRLGPVWVEGQVAQLTRRPTTSTVFIVLRDPAAALAYVRSTVCNLVRNRHRHLRVARQRTPSGPDEASSEHAVMIREDRRELLAALAALPARRREAIVLRYWLDLPEREIAAAMGVSTGTVKSHVSRGLDALGEALEGRL